MPPAPDFPPVATEAWQAALRTEVGETPLDRLAWQVDADVTLPPIVRAEDVADEAPLLRRVAALVPAAAPALTSWSPAFEADVAPMERFEETGAGPVDVLAATLASGVSDRMVVPVGPNVLLGAAGLRALRLLAARVRVDAGAPPEVRLLAVTSRFWMSRAAAHTNLLRATYGALAAFLGRADAVTVRPHDLLTGATGSARATADNVHRLLVHESHLSGDAALNAYALDLLTARLARAAWARYNDLRALDEDARLDELQRRGKAAFERVADGRTRLVGTNAFANGDDRVGPNEASERPRLAQTIEAARAAVERARDENGTPAIALLRFGDPAMSTARATFVRGLLATLGLPAVETTDLEQAEAARLVVLCSSDDEVRSQGRELARQLASSCAPPTVFVAGPEDAALRGSNVHGFVHARQPMLRAARALADAAFDAHGAPGACAL